MRTGRPGAGLGVSLDVAPSAFPGDGRVRGEDVVPVDGGGTSFRMADAPLADCLSEYAPLAAAQRQRLAALHTWRVELRRRSDLLREGDTTAWLPIVEHGWLEHDRLFADGRRFLVQVSLPGDIVDSVLAIGGRAQFSVTALTEARVRLVDSAGFVGALRDDPAIARAFMALQAAEQCRARERMVALARMSAYERLADLCLDLLGRAEAAGMAEAGGFDLPVSQRVLGEILGLHAVHVNRMFHRMEADGFIVRDGSRLRIVDRSGLENLVEFRPRHGAHALRASPADVYGME